MTIEFYGLPGSGKTTLVNQLIKENKNYYHVINSKRSKLQFIRLALARTVKYPIFIVVLLGILFSFNNVLNKLKRWFFLITLEEYKYSLENNIIYIYDQHLIQYLSSFFHLIKRRPSENLVRKIVKVFNIPDNITLIYLNTDYKKTITQFLDRKKSLSHNHTLLDTLNGEQLNNNMLELKEILEKLHFIFRNLGYKVVEINENTIDAYLNLKL